MKTLRETLTRALQVVAFGGALALLVTVLYTSTVVQGNRRAAERTAGAATARQEELETAAPQMTAAARSTAVARDLLARQSTPPALPAQDIRATNAAEVQELARWGRGVLLNVAWSPDGRFLAVGTTIGVDLYDTQSWAEMRRLDTRTPVAGIAFSPDGQRLVLTFYSPEAARSEALHVWTPATAALWEVPPDWPGAVYTARFSNEGRLLVAGTGTMGPWLWREGEGLVLPPAGAQETVPVPGSIPSDGVIISPKGLAISPDGRFLAVGEVWAGTTRVWDVAAGTPARSYTLPSFGQYLDFSPDGRFLLSATAGDVQLWWTFDGSLAMPLEQAGGPLHGAQISADGAVVVVADSQAAYLYSLYSGQLLRLLERPPVGDLLLLPGDRVALSPDGRQLALVDGPRGHVAVWPAGGESPPTILAGYGPPLREVAFAPDGSVLAARALYDATTWLWQVQEGQARHVLAREGEPLFLGGGLAFSPDGRQVAVGVGAEVHLWQVAEGHFIRTLPLYPDPTTVVTPVPGALALAFFPDGQTLAAGFSHGMVVLWRLAEDTVHVARLTDLAGEAFSGMAFTPDGAVVAAGTAGADSLLCALRVEQGDSWCRPLDPPGRLHALALSADGAVLALSTAGQVQLWGAAAGPLVRTLALPPDVQIRALAFSPNGSLLAGGRSDGAVLLWQVEDGTLLRVLPGHTSWVRGVAFAPSGGLLASVAFDGTVRLWGVSGR